MDPLQVVADESAAFLSAVRKGLDAPVPSCPGWDVRALTGHLARTHRFHAAHLVRGTTDPPTTPSPEPPADDAELLRWFEDGVELLLDACRSTGPAAPAWTWAPHVPAVAAFWPRRMALETVGTAGTRRPRTARRRTSTPRSRTTASTRCWPSTGRPTGTTSR